MVWFPLTCRQTIWSRLQEQASLHLYEIGDLDDFFFSQTSFFGGDGLATALLYQGASVPTLLAFEEEDSGALKRLVAEIAPRLPRQIYAHVSPHLVATLAEHFEFKSQSAHQKMVLSCVDKLPPCTEASVSLGPEHVSEIQLFYEQAYPNNWFEPRMLNTQMYMGRRVGGRLAAIAGVHVYSREYAVAALGNIATLPNHRGRGLAQSCTGALCTKLFETVRCVGLNVHVGNSAAIACYQRLGFHKVADYEELALVRK